MKEEEIINAFSLTRELPPEVSFEQVTSVVEQAAAGTLSAKAGAGGKVAAKNLLNIKFLSAMTGILTLAASLFLIAGTGKASAEKAEASPAPEAAIAAAPDTLIPADTAKKKKTAPAPSVTRTRTTSTTTTTTTRNSDGSSTTVSVTTSDSIAEVEVDREENGSSHSYSHSYSGGRGRSYGVGSSEKRNRTYVYTDENEEDEDGDGSSRHENVVIEVDVDENESDDEEESCQGKTVCTVDVPGAFEKELLKDGLISDTIEYRFSITRRHFYVNGKKQPEDVYKKYVKIFEEETGTKIYMLTTYSYCINRRNSE